MKLSKKFYTLLYYQNISPVNDKLLNFEEKK